MKKLLIVAVLIIGIIALCGCENKVETVDGTTNFTSVSDTAILWNGYTFYDNETGVMYLYIEGGGIGKGVTVLLNADGTPKLYGHAEYAIERVGQAEGLTGGAATKLPIADSEVYLVIFGDRAFIYEYGVSEDGTVDDTWAEQELRW